MGWTAVPLERFAMCSSRDVAEFTGRLNSVYYPAEVRPDAGPRSRGSSILRAVHDADYTLGYIRSGGVCVTPELERTDYHVNLHLSGTVAAVSGDRDVVLGPARASVHSACRRHVLRAGAGSELIGLKLTRRLVDAELAALLGRPPVDVVRFSSAFDLSTARGRSWLRSLQLVVAELGDPGLLDARLVQRQYVRMLVAGLLVAQPNNYSDELNGGHGPLRPRTLRRAMEFIDANSAAPLTATDVAAAAGCSMRRLQESFAEHLDVSPMTYLRNVRLDRARALLVDGHEIVTEVALDCGFTHLGRFASAYRERFGELPSQTHAGQKKPTREPVRRWAGRSAAGPPA